MRWPHARWPAPTTGPTGFPPRLRTTARANGCAPLRDAQAQLEPDAVPDQPAVPVQVVLVQKRERRCQGGHRALRPRQRLLRLVPGRDDGAPHATYAATALCARPVGRTVTVLPGAQRVGRSSAGRAHSSPVPLSRGRSDPTPAGVEMPSPRGGRSTRRPSSTAPTSRSSRRRRTSST